MVVASVARLRELRMGYKDVDRHDLAQLDSPMKHPDLPRLARPDEASSCLGATPWASRELASSDVYTFLATTV